MVMGPSDKDLRFPFEPTEGLGVDDPISVTLKRETRLVFWLGVHAAEDALMWDSVGGDGGVGLGDSLRECLHG
jgi:hypothetical protein